MKTKSIFFVLFAALIFTASAQSDYSSYLNKAMEKLETGDCEAAQKYYNVYQELSGETKSSVQVLIDDCTKSRNKEQTYVIGDEMHVKDTTYIVAYIRDGGKHGFAILNLGWKRLYLYTDNILRQEVPTLDELNIIYQNRDVLRMYEKYWSRTNKCNDGNTSYYIVVDFGYDKSRVYCEYYNDSNRGVVLLMYRF